MKERGREGKWKMTAYEACVYPLPVRKIKQQMKQLMEQLHDLQKRVTFHHEQMKGILFPN